jgi:ABC-type antimicrobial peptide transport system permease subunit
LLNAASPGWSTIIGVVADARTESLSEAVTPEIYRTVYQHASKGLVLLLRGQVDLRKTPVEVRQQIESIDPQLPVFQAETLDDVLAASLSVRRFAMELVAVFASAALLLAGLGIYGTISYLVSEQKREIAIRLALGARKRTIVRMVLRQGLGLTSVGAGLGIVGALVVSHLMAGLLYGVSPADLPTFAIVTVVLTAVAVAACYLPARRAMLVDPLVALREA